MKISIFYSPWPQQSTVVTLKAQLELSDVRGRSLRRRPLAHVNNRRSGVACVTKRKAPLAESSPSLCPLSDLKPNACLGSDSLAVKTPPNIFWAVLFSVFSTEMALVGVQENGNGEMGFSGIPLGTKNKYRRMDSELPEASDDASHHHHQEGSSKNTRKYVFACAVFASLNSVLLGYGMFFISAFEWLLLLLLFFSY